MSTQFGDKDQALAYAAFGVGVDKSTFDDVQPETLHIGWPQDVDVEAYTILNKDGREVTFGIGQFRDGVDLWVINRENGLSLRL